MRPGKAKGYLKISGSLIYGRAGNRVILKIAQAIGSFFL